MEKFYRISCNNIGIYEALKIQIWNTCNNPVEEWTKLKLSDSFKWLENPNIKYKNCKSYFTEMGFQKFMNFTYPILCNYLSKEEISIDSFMFHKNKMDIIYEDEHQVVIKKLDKSNYDEKVIKARNFCHKVRKLAQKFELPFFVVTDGASATSNNGCDAVKNAREHHIKWELEHKHDPYEDWSKDK